MNKFIMIIQVFVAGFLLVAGVDYFVHATVDVNIKIMLSTLLIVDGLIYLFYISKRIHTTYLVFVFSIIIFVNIILTYTDEIGGWDYMILFSNLTLIIYYLHYLAKLRKAKP